jgi:penicillin amidase
MNTNSTETRDDIIEQAVIGAHTELIGLLGPNEEDWSWGMLHTAAFNNETLGQSGIPPIEWLFNRSAPERVGGSQSIVNATGWDPFDGYAVDWIPSFRMVVDLSDLSNSTAIHSTGNSGHAFHRNYDDMIVDWTDGIQNPLRWALEQVTLDAEDTLTLVPLGS